MRGKRRVALTVALEDVSYEMAFGFVTPVPGTRFSLDPEMKTETLSVRQKSKKVVLAERKAQSAWLRDDEGNRVSYPLSLDLAESMLSQIKDPHRFEVLDLVRKQLLAWRFYHHFPTDKGSPLRSPQPGVRTPVMSGDGRDVAAALQTIREIGDDEALDAAIEQAFPDSELVITENDGRFGVALTSPGTYRPFGAMELSDGTLRYLCLLAALLSPRPAPLLVLNEPETSLHEDLLAPLAKLIALASERSQIWITTHSPRLASLIAEDVPTEVVNIEKRDGATVVDQSD